MKRKIKNWSARLAQELERGKRQRLALTGASTAAPSVVRSVATQSTPADDRARDIETAAALADPQGWFNAKQAAMDKKIDGLLADLHGKASSSPESELASLRQQIRTEKDPVKLAALARRARTIRGDDEFLGLNN